MKEKSLELKTLKQKLLGLILTVSLSQIYSQLNKEVISKIKTQNSKIKAKEGPNRKFWLEDVLWKTPSLIHYF